MLTTRENVQKYYGQKLKSNKDLKTSACCSESSIPGYQKEILGLIEEEIKGKFYGCGSPIPLELGGKCILDLGCGSGRDAYLASYLVGQEGKVIGIDMTDEQLEIANEFVKSHTKKFNFDKPNISFVKGYMEDLHMIEDSSVDIVMSNCVINLSPRKEKVFKEIFRVLKEGGELIFSDVFCSQRIPDELKEDQVLYGECLSGAMYLEDFRRILTNLGYYDFRILKKTNISLSNPDVKKKLNGYNFYSITLRIFKIQNLENRCEDYGQTAVYKGTINETPNSFTLDDHHIFLKNKPLLVCGNTADMLSKTRFSKHFVISGNKKTHYGLFDCKPVVDSNGGGCC